MTQRFIECAPDQADLVLRLVSIMAATLMSIGLVHAAEPMSASALSAQGPQVLTLQSYSVVRGDTLDRVIQKTLSNSPLKIELLRKAFVDLNPQAFVAGNVARLRAGVVLQVPDHAQLLRSTILPVLESAGAAPVLPSARPPNANDDRRNWVRFP